MVAQAPPTLVGQPRGAKPGNLRRIVGYILLFVSIVFFLIAYGGLVNSVRMSRSLLDLSFYIAFALLVVSIFLVMSASSTGPRRAVAPLAVIGIVLAIAGAVGYAFFLLVAPPWLDFYGIPLTSAWVIVMLVGLVIAVAPSIAYVVIARAKTR